MNRSHRDPKVRAEEGVCRADAAWATKLCRQVVETVRQGSGAGAIRHQDPLSRIVSDIEALSVHSFLLLA